jgi:hypothetical protein
MTDYLQIFISIMASAGTIVGAMAAVRYEVRSRVDSLNQQVIGLQDRKIKLLTDELQAVKVKAEADLAERDKRIAELEGAVKILTERLMRRGRMGIVKKGDISR